MTQTTNVTSLERRGRTDRINTDAIPRRGMKFNVGGVLALLALASIFVAFFLLFTVPQTSQALVVRLGDPIRTISEPGLHMKMPSTAFSPSGAEGCGGPVSGRSASSFK